VLHGHAHHGAPEGRTAGGVPVYNVSMSLLTAAYPERPPFRLIELPAPVSTATASSSDLGREGATRGD
jgi:hypothetical protein